MSPFTRLSRLARNHRELAVPTIALTVLAAAAAGYGLAGSQSASDHGFQSVELSAVKKPVVKPKPKVTPKPVVKVTPKPVVKPKPKVTPKPVVKVTPKPTPKVTPK